VCAVQGRGTKDNADKTHPHRRGKPTDPWAPHTRAPSTGNRTERTGRARSPRRAGRRGGRPPQTRRSTSGLHHCSHQRLGLCTARGQGAAGTSRACPAGWRWRAQPEHTPRAFRTPTPTTLSPATPPLHRGRTHLVKHRRQVRQQCGLLHRDLAGSPCVNTVWGPWHCQQVCSEGSRRVAGKLWLRHGLQQCVHTPNLQRGCSG
jgi:hypothetical protein